MKITSIILSMGILFSVALQANEKKSIKDFSPEYREKIENRNIQEEPKLSKEHLELLNRIDKLSR